MENHYFMVSWDTFTRTRYSCRHYSHEFKTKDEAIKKARAVSENVLSDFIKVYEGESYEDETGCVHITFLGWVNWKN